MTHGLLPTLLPSCFPKKRQRLFSSQNIDRCSQSSTRDVSVLAPICIACKVITIMTMMMIMIMITIMVIIMMIIMMMMMIMIMIMITIILKIMMIIMMMMIMIAVLCG